MHKLLRLSIAVAEDYNNEVYVALGAEVQKLKAVPSELTVCIALWEM